MAGEDDGYTGEARLTPGSTVGHLPQEPVLDPSTDVLGNVMQGVAPVADLVTRYEEVCAAFAEPDADRKSTRLNSSHANISYAVFCLRTTYSTTSMRAPLAST